MKCVFAHEAQLKTCTYNEGKDLPITCHGGTEGEERYSSILSLTMVLYGGGWLTPCPLLLAPVKESTTTELDAGWAPKAVLDALVRKSLYCPSQESNDDSSDVQPLA